MHMGQNGGVDALEIGGESLVLALGLAVREHERVVVFRLAFLQVDADEAQVLAVAFGDAHDRKGYEQGVVVAFLDAAIFMVAAACAEYPVLNGR